MSLASKRLLHVECASMHLCNFNGLRTGRKAKPSYTMPADRSRARVTVTTTSTRNRHWLQIWVQRARILFLCVAFWLHNLFKNQYSKAKLQCSKSISRRGRKTRLVNVYGCVYNVRAALQGTTNIKDRHIDTYWAVNNCNNGMHNAKRLASAIWPVRFAISGTVWLYRAFQPVTSFSISFYPLLLIVYVYCNCCSLFYLQPCRRRLLYK